jgi:hypothetical protein
MGTEKSPLFFLTYEHASLEFLYGEKTSRSRQSNFIFLKLFGSLITTMITCTMFRRAEIDVFGHPVPYHEGIG